MTPFRRPIDGVIFDMDGLLLDTEEVYRQAFIGAAASLGFELPEDFYRRMVGLADGECYALIQHQLGPSVSMMRYRGEVDTWMQRLLSTGIPIKPGAVELIDDFVRHGLPIVVATSTNRTTAESHLGQSGFLQRIDTIVTWQDVERGKPHPDIFIKAALEIGVAPQRCLVLEDSPLGICGAHAAGTMPVMVPDLLAATDELRRMCVAVVADLYEARALLRDYWRGGVSEASFTAP
jgi:HAD superfamily hydrolase (TIGR01509 family)